MAENRRGAIRKNPDPMALATKGRKTTYEGRDIAGVNVIARLKGRIKARTKL